MNKSIVLSILLIGTVLSICPRSCILDPEVTEGPYYVDLQNVRQDIREDKSGIPLYLDLTVIDYNTCSPVTNSGVEIWHCAADGIYSHFEEASEGIQNPQTDDTTYLRGIQLADSEGSVSFLTIYPGWYQGRALHIHLKVHVNGTEGTVVHTGQLFFEEVLNEEIEKYEPYASRTITRLTNANDGIYNQGGYYGLIETYEYVDASDITQGIKASINLGVDSGFYYLETADVVTTDESTYVVDVVTTNASTNIADIVTTDESTNVADIVTTNASTNVVNAVTTNESTNVIIYDENSSASSCISIAIGVFLLVSLLF